MSPNWEGPKRSGDVLWMYITLQSMLTNLFRVIRQLMYDVLLLNRRCLWYVVDIVDTRVRHSKSETCIR